MHRTLAETVSRTEKAQRSVEKVALQAAKRAEAVEIHTEKVESEAVQKDMAEIRTTIPEHIPDFVNARSEIEKEYSLRIRSSLDKEKLLARSFQSWQTQVVKEKQLQSRIKAFDRKLAFLEAQCKHKVLHAWHILTIKGLYLSGSFFKTQRRSHEILKRSCFTEWNRCTNLQKDQVWPVHDR